jgi:hypothetical protein
LGLLSIKILAAVASFVALFLIAEDIFVTFSGGEGVMVAFLGKINKAIQEIPYLGKVLAFVNEQTQKTFAIFAKGNVIEQFKQAFIGLGYAIKDYFISSLNFIIEKIKNIPKIALAAIGKKTKGFFGDLFGFDEDVNVGINRSPAQDIRQVTETQNIINRNNTKNNKENNIKIENVSVNANSEEAGREAARGFTEEIQRVLNQQIRNTQLAFPE